MSSEPKLQVDLVDPEERSRRGAHQQALLLGVPATEPRTVLEAASRDYVFSEVWTRPGLDRRSRYLIAISGAACEGGRPDVLDGYLRGALKVGELTIRELHETALHLAVYAGWSQGIALDVAIARVAADLGLAAPACTPLRERPWSPEQRIAEGSATFAAVMPFPAPRPVTPLFEAGIINFVFGEVWKRPGLDQRSRLWITLVGVAHSGSMMPVRAYTYAALSSGHVPIAELHEFVLQFAIHGGWPRATVMQGVASEMAERVSKGLPFQ